MAIYYKGLRITTENSLSMLSDLTYLLEKGIINSEEGKRLEQMVFSTVEDRVLAKEIIDNLTTGQLVPQKLN